jgi:HAE1 family hydrophobic/amphiphilic exporter-1
MLAMYVLLSIEFKSYVQPILVLLIIPFGMIGAIAGHAIMGLPLTIFSLFGVVALSGIVINDSIVLTDFINRMRRSGMSVQQALVQAGQRRFRPVMLTTVTTVGGLTPILMETSFQAQMLIPMATSIAFGEIFATILVLFLVPVLYSIYAGACKRLGVAEDEFDEEHDVSPEQKYGPVTQVDVSTTPEAPVAGAV